jgi:striatin 1/3/4
VRCLRFHATEPLLITGSEDETLKLWNLNKTVPSNKGIKSSLIRITCFSNLIITHKKKIAVNKQQQPTGPISGTTFDLEPVYTFRGHTSRVLSLAVNNNTIYSGSQNGQIMIWSIPSNIPNIDPYDAYDSTLQICQIEAHTNAIWSLVAIQSTSSSSPLICSAAADKTIKIWDTSRILCLKTITLEGISLLDYQSIN